MNEQPLPRPDAGEPLRPYQPPRIVYKAQLKQFSGSPLVIEPGSPDPLGLPH